MIGKIYIKLKQLYYAIKQKKFYKLNKNVIKVSDNTVILQGSTIEFRTTKDDRIYLELGSGSLVSFKIIFETNQGFVKIGNNVNMGNTMIISRESIIIEDDVTMAWGINLYDHNSHSIYWEERKNDNATCYIDYKKYGNSIISKNWAVVKSSPIRICKKAWIGFNVTILKGVTIGEGAVIGAGSVVTKDVPAYTVSAGNPARVVKSIKA